jgi:hypothetical protein
MPDLINKLKRGIRKPVPYIAARIVQELKAGVEKMLAPRRAARLDGRRLCVLLEAKSIDDLWDRLAVRPFPFVPRDVKAFDHLCPGERERIRRDSADAMDRRVNLLGSGPVYLDTPTDWSRDFVTGRRWPNAFFRTIDTLDLDRSSDVKVPWELSRLQWLVPLAQLYVLERDERHAAAVRGVVEDWIDGNPYAWSVNWTCTMEVALRILTFTWLFHALHDSAAFTEAGFRAKFLTAVYLHADFTERHIERSDINGNHFNAAAAGLAFAGLFFGRGRAPGRWLAQGLAELSREITPQNFPDGVNYEASIPYHRLNCELFALPAIYARACGITVAEVWRSRLAAMGRFVAAYMRDDGSSAVFGDADNARTLPMAQVQGEFADHRYLIALIGTFADDLELLRRFSGPVHEVYWLCGPAVVERLLDHVPPLRRSEHFPDGGFFVLARGGDHVVVDCGPVGLDGRGGHGHNDILSIEAALDGEVLIVDSGCYVYTASVEERNRFRSTAAHNTPQIDGEEINRFVTPTDLWHLRNDATPVVLDVQRDSLTISHTGFDRLAEPVRPVRRIVLSDGRLSIEDRFDGRGRHRISVPLHLAPSVLPSVCGERTYLLETPRRAFELVWSGAAGWACRVEGARLAPSYGTILRSKKIVWSYDGPMPAPLLVTIARVRT